MAETDVIANQVDEPVLDAAKDDAPAIEEKPVDDSKEVARLKAEIAKHKAALDKATKEAGEYKKQLRASKSAEEQRAEEEKERQEAIQQELETLRKQSAVATISKSVMSFVGDESVSTTIAEALYGAADVDGALDALSKAWATREKKLKLEYGKIPAPEAGDGAPQTTAADLSKMSYRERLDFKQKYPDTYKKVMSQGA